MSFYCNLLDKIFVLIYYIKSLQHLFMSLFDTSNVDINEPFPHFLFYELFD